MHFLRENTECPVCGAETENLEHFLSYYERYKKERNKIWKLQQPYEDNKEPILGSVLFDFESKDKAENI